jgi:erythronate-4-phosphate dehydrogenase
MKIVADANIAYVREAFSRLGEVQLLPAGEISRQAVRDAEVLLVRSVTRVDAGLLEGSAVRFVGTATSGADHVDRAYLQAKGIGFGSAEGSNANSVAEYVVAALLELAWRGKFRLRERTLGVVGVGRIGARVARMARALGMRVLENDPPRQRVEKLPQFVSLQQLLAASDIVTVHVPLDDSTRHLFNAENLRGFMLINTARGAVVDNTALLKAIDANRVTGAVLDVWENEPDILPELLDVVDIGTPHIAGYSLDGKVAGTRMIYEAACRFFGVEPNWRPALPPPPVSRLVVQIQPGEDPQDVLRRVVKTVYDIAADDAALRLHPREFERLRTQYPVRREFFNTELLLKWPGGRLHEEFAALGFKLA